MGAIGLSGLGLALDGAFVVDRRSLGRIVLDHLASTIGRSPPQPVQPVQRGLELIARHFIRFFRNLALGAADRPRDDELGRVQLGPIQRRGCDITSCMPMIASCMRCAAAGRRVLAASRILPRPAMKKGATMGALFFAF